MRRLYYFILKLLYLPIFILRKVKIGKQVNIEPRVFISKTTVGSYSYLGHNCVIDKAVIGNYCSIAAFVHIGGMEHSHWWWSTSTKLSDKGKKNQTIIGNDVWIGSKVTIREGLKIGNGVVIGSNSVVLSDIEPYSIVVGIPGRVVRKRFSDEEIKILEETKYYNLDPANARRILNNLPINNINY